MINIFVFVAAPLYGLIFTTTFEPLIGEFSGSLTYLYIYLILLNLGAALGIILVNIYSIKYEFLNFLSAIDISIIFLEALTLVSFVQNNRTRYIIFLIKKIGLGAAIGINFYLALLIVKKKFTLFNDFCRMAILMYIFFGIGFGAGIVVNDVMKAYNVYLPFISIYSCFRLIYVKRYVKKEMLEPNEQSPLTLSRKTSYSIINELSRAGDPLYSRNTMVAKLFSNNQIKFLIGYYLITIASEITPNLELSIISMGMTKIPQVNWLFAFFELCGTISIYFIIKKIENKLKYYLLMALAISFICYLIGYVMGQNEQVFTMLLIYIYMFLYGASLGPFFYIFVGYRYSRIGFSICYINKWLIYALSAVLNSIANKRLQIIITASILIFIVVILYFLLKDQELKEIEQQKQFERLESKMEEISLPEENSELRDSNIVDLE